mgnify:CR=1 FL=1
MTLTDRMSILQPEIRLYSTLSQTWQIWSLSQPCKQTILGKIQLSVNVCPTLYCWVVQVVVEVAVVIVTNCYFFRSV